MKSLPRVPLQEAWGATYGVVWSSSEFDLRKAFFCSVFSELVYRYIPGLTVGDQNRMWMVPCRAYQLLASGTVDEDFMETLQRMEANEAERFFVNTENVVGVGIKQRGIIIVALRGTAHFYDVILDLMLNPVVSLPKSKVPRFHLGFKSEAARCFADMQTRLQTWGAPKVPVYLTGHSLGGAIAGVIMALESTAPLVNAKSLITAAYTFGMPCYGNKAAIHNDWPKPFPTIRAKDPVPWLPPRILGYEHCPEEFDIRGMPIKRGQIDNPISRFLYRNHYIERYRRDLHSNF
jgi:hypothetical protein